MSYTKAEYEKKWHESRDLAKELTKEKQELQEDNLRLREENARLSALVDELNNCNEGLRARLKVIEVEMEAAELEARSAALADEADALVESLPVAPVKPAVRKPNCDQIAATLGTREKQIQAYKARFEQKRAERKAKEAAAKPELDPEPELEPAPEPEPIPEPEKAEVKELPTPTDPGAEKIIEITPKEEVVFEAEETEEIEEDNRVSLYHPFGEKKPLVARPRVPSRRLGFRGRLSKLTEGELDDD